MSKNKKKSNAKNNKKKTVIIVLCIILGFLLFAGGFAAWFINDKLNNIEYETENSTIPTDQTFVDDENLDFGEIDDATGNTYKEILKNWATNNGEKMSDKKILNILLVGIDNSKSGISTSGNTDVMMLVSINRDAESIKLISFMRDSYTYMTGYDTYGKLNAACANGGATYLIETIENDYKIKIDGYALVNFDSFCYVIDTVGGVDVNVPDYVADHLSTKLDGTFPRGNTTLNGEQALRFCRVRATDKNGDVSRVARQRQVISSLINKCKNASLSQINEVFDIVLANVRTNFPKKEILGYATQAVTDGWAKYKISELTMPTPNARYGYMSNETKWIWVVDYPLCAQKIQTEIYGKTNINLPEDRETAITVMGGKVSNSTSD